MFLFQVAPGRERIVVHGFDRIFKALFAVYASLTDGGHVIVEGTSDQTATSGTALIIDPLKTYKGMHPHKAFYKFWEDYLLQEAETFIL